LKNEDEVNRTIDSILEDIKGTDSGASVPADLRARIDGNINKLIELSSRQSSPLENAALFNSYTVAYSSPGPKQKGAPAGGRFRGKMGRLLFRTTGLYQMILRPNLAKNLVSFKLFGILPGSIALVGTFVKLNAKTVKVLFERPKFTLLGQTFSFGPKSSVELETPCFYANKIRVGRGSLGSLFVFTVDEKSQRESVLREVDRTPRPYAVVVLAAIVAAALYALRFLQTKLGGAKAPMVAACVLLVATASVLVRGGIDDFNECEEDKQKAAAAAASGSRASSNGATP